MIQCVARCPAEGGANSGVRLAFYRHAVPPCGLAVVCRQQGQVEASFVEQQKPALTVQPSGPSKASTVGFGPSSYTGGSTGDCAKLEMSSASLATTRERMASVFVLSSADSCAACMCCNCNVSTASAREAKFPEGFDWSSLVIVAPGQRAVDAGVSWS